MHAAEPRFGGQQSSRRSLPISRLCLANTRRPKRNGALSSRRRESLSVSSFAVERSDVSTRSLERPRGFPLSSRGTSDRETDERPPSRLRTLTNERLTDARSHPLLGRLLTSSCWTVRLTNPRTTRSRDCGTPGLGCLSRSARRPDFDFQGQDFGLGHPPVLRPGLHSAHVSCSGAGRIGCRPSVPVLPAKYSWPRHCQNSMSSAVCREKALYRRRAILKDRCSHPDG